MQAHINAIHSFTNSRALHFINTIPILLTSKLPKAVAASCRHGLLAQGILEGRVCKDLQRIVAPNIVIVAGVGLDEGCRGVHPRQRASKGEVGRQACKHHGLQRQLTLPSQF